MNAFLSDHKHSISSSSFFESFILLYIYILYSTNVEYKLNKTIAERNISKKSKFYLSVGFFLPAKSFSTILAIRSVRVFSCLASSIQTMYSLRCDQARL